MCLSYELKMYLGKDVVFTERFLAARIDNRKTQGKLDNNSTPGKNNYRHNDFKETRKLN